eukprot:115903-Pleurochrysis_carterae.AAC.2
MRTCRLRAPLATWARRTRLIRRALSALAAAPPASSARQRQPRRRKCARQAASAPPAAHSRGCAAPVPSATRLGYRARSSARRVLQVMRVPRGQLHPPLAALAATPPTQAAAAPSYRP